MSAPGPDFADKAGRAHWDVAWLRDAPAPVDADDRRLRNHVNLRLVRLLDGLLPRPAPAGALLVEAGCGGSAWLPLFATRYGYDVAGVDFSEAGCGLARATLERAGVSGRIVRADLFDPPGELAACADVVFSQGLAEHFTPTSALTRRLAWLLKPGGLAVTLVPNMRGLTGLLQRVCDRRVFDLHVPLTPAALARAHAEAGLKPVESGWLGTLNLGVVNLSGLPRAVGRPLSMAFAAVSMAVWTLERTLGGELPGRFASPVAWCAARKPAG